MCTSADFLTDFMYIVFVSRDKSRWLCTYCVFKTNQTCIDRQQSREAAMSRNTSHHMLVRPLPCTFFFFFCILLLFLPHCLFPVSPTGVSVSSPASVHHWWTRGCSKLQPLCESLFFFLNRSISPIFRSVWVFHNLSAAVGGVIRCLPEHKAAAGPYSGQTQREVLSHCWRICVQLGARSCHIHFKEPGKTTVREALGFRKDQVLFSF